MTFTVSKLKQSRNRSSHLYLTNARYRAEPAQREAQAQAQHCPLVHTRAAASERETLTHTHRVLPASTVMAPSLRQGIRELTIMLMVIGAYESGGGRAGDTHSHTSSPVWCSLRHARSALPPTLSLSALSLPLATTRHRTPPPGALLPLRAHACRSQTWSCCPRPSRSWPTVPPRAPYRAWPSCNSRAASSLAL